MVKTNEPGFGNGSMGDYELVMQCGSGTYGSVFRAIHKSTRRVVALKKVTKYPLEDGCPVECKYLEQLYSSNNIINMLEYFYMEDGQLVLIFEYMETDLWKLISGPKANVPILQTKCIMKQLFEGLQQCHSAGIMHRDVKPSNLLINSSGVLKLADFGLTTSFVKPLYLSNNVVSLYYRPPELLLGSHDYGPEIDIWSAGCILVELLTNDYLFAGENESDQLDLIFQVFGTPDEKIWPGVSKLPGFGLVESRKQHPLRDLHDNYHNLDSNAIDLASQLLQLNPKKRITSFEALNHPWFTAAPLPCIPSLLPSLWKDKKVPAKVRAAPAPPPPIDPPQNYNANFDSNANNNNNNNTNNNQNNNNFSYYDNFNNFNAQQQQMNYNYYNNMNNFYPNGGYPNNEMVFYNNLNYYNNNNNFMYFYGNNFNNFQQQDNCNYNSYYANQFDQYNQYYNQYNNNNYYNNYGNKHGPRVKDGFNRRRNGYGGPPPRHQYHAQL